MKRLKVLVGLVVFFGFLLVGYLFSADTEGWWDGHWEYRVGLSFKNDLGIDLTNQPVVISGDDLFKKTGMKGIHTTSLRLIGEEIEVPIQVDERDNTGLFVKEPNYLLDKDDEIVFEVDIPKGKEAHYYLYFSTQPKPVGGPYQTDIEVLHITSDIGQIKINNSNLYFVVKGPRTNPEIPPEKVHFANYGCGAITSLVIKGIECLHSIHSYGQVIPSGGVSIPYSVPEVVIDGPIRKVIKVLWDSHQIKDKEEKVAFEGKEVRYFSIYKGSNRIDFEDSFFYTIWDLSIWQRVIGDAEPLVKYSPSYASGIFDINDSLFIPVAGKISEIDIGKTELQEDGNQVFYNTSSPEEGWFCWLDKKDNVGLATFFNPGLFRVNIFSHNPKKNLGQTWANPSNYLWYKIPAEVPSKNSLKIGITFFGIEQREEISPLYRFWKDPEIKFGFVEKGDIK